MMEFWFQEQNRSTVERRDGIGETRLRSAISFSEIRIFVIPKFGSLPLSRCSAENFKSTAKPIFDFLHRFDPLSSLFFPFSELIL
jgi:hypothetical protein